MGIFDQAFNNLANISPVGWASSGKDLLFGGLGSAISGAINNKFQNQLIDKANAHQLNMLDKSNAHQLQMQGNQHEFQSGLANSLQSNLLQHQANLQSNALAQQKDLAVNAMQYKLKDMENAGINPMAAFGATGASGAGSSAKTMQEPKSTGANSSKVIIDKIQIYK